MQQIVVNFHLQLFTFFSQQGMTNNSFPCNTVAGSRIGRIVFIDNHCVDLVYWTSPSFKVDPVPSLLCTGGLTARRVEAWAGKKYSLEHTICNHNADQHDRKKMQKSREELTFSSCTSLDDVTPWCYTRIKVGRLCSTKINFWKCRTTWGPLTATGVTAPPPALGSCPLPPASTVSPLDQTFGTSLSLTSPPGVLASATHTIRQPRWALNTR